MVTGRTPGIQKTKIHITIGVAVAVYVRAKSMQTPIPITKAVQANAVAPTRDQRPMCLLHLHRKATPTQTATIAA